LPPSRPEYLGGLQTNKNWGYLHEFSRKKFEKAKKVTKLPALTVPVPVTFFYDFALKRPATLINAGFFYPCFPNKKCFFSYPGCLNKDHFDLIFQIAAILTS
jgi:hypothetical protein